MTYERVGLLHAGLLHLLLVVVVVVGVFPRGFEQTQAPAKVIVLLLGLAVADGYGGGRLNPAGMVGELSGQLSLRDRGNI